MVKTNVSDVSTDVVLFSEHGLQLVHHYRVFGDCVAHVSLFGSFMIDLLYFTTRAYAKARWAAKCSRDSGASSSPDRLGRSLRDAARRTMDDDPPARKAVRVVTSATSDDARRRMTMHDESSPVSTLTEESVAQYRAPPALMMGPLPSDVAAAFRHSGCRTGYHTVTPGRDPAVPTVAREPVVDPLI